MAIWLVQLEIPIEAKTRQEAWEKAEIIVGEHNGATIEILFEPEPELGDMQWRPSFIN